MIGDVHIILPSILAIVRLTSVENSWDFLHQVSRKYTVVSVPGERRTSGRGQVRVLYLPASQVYVCSTLDRYFLDFILVSKVIELVLNYNNTLFELRPTLYYKTMGSE